MVILNIQFILGFDGMNKVLFLLPVLLLSIGMNYSYAQTIENVETVVLDYDGSSVSVQISWSPNDAASNYEAGCVSCMPNISESTTNTSIVLDNVTPMPNTDRAMLYLIAYDSNSEIVDAKQLIVSLE